MGIFADKYYIYSYLLIDINFTDLRASARLACAQGEGVNGHAFFLDPAFDAEAGTAEGIGVSYDGLPADVQAGDRLLLDDGRIVVEVERVAGTRLDVRRQAVVADADPLGRARFGIECR
ncbi:MAG: pyruvate kinase, partial [Bacteroidales bacterium]